MDSNTFSGIVWGVAVAGIFVWAVFAYYRRLRRTERLQIAELLKQYFQRSISIDELDRRIRRIAGSHFMQGAAFYSLAFAAFQHAVDAKLEPTDEGKLLVMFAALRNKFGLTERYKIEGWRAGRE